MTKKVCWKAKPIFLKLGKWIKSRKTQYFLGEEIDLELDLQNIGGNIDGPESSKINTFARWNNQKGTSIKDSKTTQDDNGNTITEADYNGPLLDRTENTLANNQADAVKEVVVHEKGGIPSFRWKKKGKQTWDASVKFSDNYFSIAGSNTLDPTQRGEFLNISTRGAVLKPNQPQAMAILETNVPNITGDDVWYDIGTTETWNVIEDEYNSLNPGGSPTNPLSYTTKYKGRYLIKMQLQYTASNDTGSGQIRIKTDTRNFFAYNTFAIGFTNHVDGSFNVSCPANDVITFATLVDLFSPERKIGLQGSSLPDYKSYLSIYFLG